MKKMFFALIFVLAFMGCSNVIKQEDCQQVKSGCISVCIEKRFDANGNVIYEKYNDGYEMIAEYDERNNCIYENYFGRYIKKTEYDSYNRKIHEIYVILGAEYWYEYVTFENGSIKTKVIKSNSGYIETREYDILGNGIHWFDNSGYEAWGEYYPDGTQKKVFDTEGRIKLYNEDGYIIYDKKENGLEIVCDYDKNYNYTHFKCSDGYERWEEVDPDGNVIYFKDSEGNNSLDEYLESR